MAKCLLAKYPLAKCSLAKYPGFGNAIFKGSSFVRDTSDFIDISRFRVRSQQENVTSRSTSEKRILVGCILARCAREFLIHMHVFMTRQSLYGVRAS